MIIIDADDFHEHNSKLGLLEQLHDATGMKFTLFTIPGLCSRTFVKSMQQIEWLDLVPHGFMHPHPRECEHWNYNQCVAYLDWVEDYHMTKGFKAPGWQISDDMYRALLERGYWVADQHYNDHRRPPGLRAYFCEPAHHFHIGHMGGHNENEIELHTERLLQMKGEFGFIKEVI